MKRIISIVVATVALPLCFAVAADWSKPALTDSYANFLNFLNAKINDSLLWMDSAKTTPVNVPNDAKRWDSAGKTFQRYSSNTWVGLSTSYAIDISGNAATATNAANLGGQPGIYYQNADNLNAGTIPAGRIPATLPAVSGANLTGLNASNLATGTVPPDRFPATLPAASGANLTNLNASNLSSGTIPPERLPGSLMPAGAIIPFAMPTCPNGWLAADGAAVSRTTYPDLYNYLVVAAGFTSQTFTATIANPAVFTKTTHGFNGGERLRLSTTGALPSPLSTTADYFVEIINADTFYLSATPGGTRISTLGSTQSGSQIYSQSWWGLGDGTTTFNLPDMRGEFARGWDNGRGVDSGRSFATNQSSANLSHNHGVYNGAYLVSTGATTIPRSYAAGGRTVVNDQTIASGGNEARPRNISLNYCIKH